MRKLLLRFLPFTDVALMVLIYPAAWLLKAVRRVGLHRLPRSKNVLLDVGVFPIRNHYYEPQFDHRFPRSEFSQDRTLPGIDWNVSGQLEMLKKLQFAQELTDVPKDKTGNLTFHLNNRAFGPGDAEYWYQLIRTIKPRRIIEIGSGNSTLLAIKAIRRNHEDDSGYKCMHVCIEPYQVPWLEESGVSVVRRKVEEVDLSFFSELQENDILFIDSSHMIRPQGDVLFEYLEILPTLGQGVIVHIHDIFSPKDYPKHWLQDVVIFWNEQYLLEAFLSQNGGWTILGAVNYLKHNHFEELRKVAPFLTQEYEPGSFYMQKTA